MKQSSQPAVSAPKQSEFDEVKARLEEIAIAVDDEELSLDDALDLYEEAVTLGLRASDLLEIGVEDDDGQEGSASSERTSEPLEADAARDADAPRSQDDSGDGEPARG